MEFGFLCSAPPPSLPPIVPAPFEANGHITFGSFNNTSKLSDSVLAWWAEILQRVPRSQLTFKYGDRFESEWLCERYRAIFASSGVDPARLTFLPVAKTVVAHLEAIANVDIALDTYPYQGTHTTLETLTMSVPVISLCGETYVRPACLVGVNAAVGPDQPRSNRNANGVREVGPVEASRQFRAARWAGG